LRSQELPDAQRKWENRLLFTLILEYVAESFKTQTPDIHYRSKVWGHPDNFVSSMKTHFYLSNELKIE